DLGQRYLHCEAAPQFLFTNNESNTNRLIGQPNRTIYVKEGINDYVVHGNKAAVNPEAFGTKAAAHYQITVPSLKKQIIRLRLTDENLSPNQASFGESFQQQFVQRRREATRFYSTLTPKNADVEIRKVMRQGLAGMLWSKQTYI